ncbi:sugar transferase [Tautonia marina]|uniref:sugar transferase n=1 Tax=Tautonia marina TaxID=2653855 RepID=UPI00191C6EDF|nr:sugar transferase [Tautonia marina]
MASLRDDRLDAREAFKRITDRVSATLLLIWMSPVIVLAMLLVKLTSRGPAIYAQERLGRGGTPFTIYKIRTMTHDCERDTGPTWCVPDDPRVTPIGRILRRTHLDELPQLWNVIRGELSLVGPRPERPAIAAKLELTVPRYRDRLLVRPGLTGLAQVQLEPDTDVTSVRRKLFYDLYYVRNASPWLDLRITASTFFYIAGVPASLLARVFGFPRLDTEQS